jgi:hypothetical protein
MFASTGARVRHPPLRRIAWQVLDDERETSDQVWSALPPRRATRADVEKFLQDEGLAAGEDGSTTLYTYADGPRVAGSPVQSEWYLEFRFAKGKLVELAVEKRLLGP